MIHFFKRYAQVKAEVDMLEADIEMTVKERQRISNRGYDMNTWLHQLDRIQKNIDEMCERVDIKKEYIKKADDAMRTLYGLEYQIARMKYIDGKNLYEIAEELGYSYDHIRRAHSQLVKSCHNDDTEMKESS